MCMKARFSRASNVLSRVLRCMLSFSYLSNVSLLMHVERTSSNQCPFLYRLKEKNNYGVWQIPWQTGINGLNINIHCLVPGQWRLLNDSDNKSSMSCLCYGKRSNMPSGLRDATEISSALELPCERSIFDWWSLDPSDSTGVMNTIIMQITINQNSSEIGAA